MTKIHLLSIMLILLSSKAYDQQDIRNRLDHNVSEYPPLYIFDGLRIDQEKFIELKIDKNCIKKIKVNEDYTYCDSTQKFNGLITVYSKLLIVLNDKPFFDSKDKIKVLSKLNKDDILSFKMLNKQEALNKYGKYGKFGALIIKTE